MAKKSSSGGGTSKVFLGFLLGAATVAGGGYAWIHYGGSAQKLRKDLPSLPAGLTGDGGTSGDPSMAKPSAEREHVKRTPPFGTSEDVFEAGAHTYRAHCAVCHGTPNHDAAGKGTASAATQLWKKGADISATDPGDIYTRIAHGKHGSMPAFAGKLNDTQIWQVVLLLKNSSSDLPDPVINILEKK
jgi:mono/diheme cytochrome c family protein